MVKIRNLSVFSSVILTIYFDFSSGYVAQPFSLDNTLVTTASLSIFYNIS